MVRLRSQSLYGRSAGKDRRWRVFPQWIATGNCVADGTFRLGPVKRRRKRIGRSNYGTTAKRFSSTRCFTTCLACRPADSEAIIARMISAEELVGEQWAEWYRLKPAERWIESAKLWQVYLSLGGSLDPEPDTQSPFFDPATQSSRPVDGRPGVRVIRRGRI